MLKCYIDIFLDMNVFQWWILQGLILKNRDLSNFYFTRAPVLVALALIEGGMKYEDAVQFIRQ